MSKLTKKDRFTKFTINLECLSTTNRLVRSQDQGKIALTFQLTASTIETIAQSKLSKIILEISIETMLCWFQIRTKSSIASQTLWILILSSSTQGTSHSSWAIMPFNLSTMPHIFQNKIKVISSGITTKFLPCTTTMSLRITFLLQIVIRQRGTIRSRLFSIMTPKSQMSSSNHQCKSA